MGALQQFGYWRPELTTYRESMRFAKLDIALAIVRFELHMELRRARWQEIHGRFSDAYFWL